MKAEYIRLIEELDRVLDTLRGFWLEAKTTAETAKHRNRIDALLDERLRLMGLRDSSL